MVQFNGESNGMLMEVKMVQIHNEVITKGDLGCQQMEMVDQKHHVTVFLVCTCVK